MSLVINPSSGSTRRPGLTLVEVLATIFILGIGMLSILVLFPVGAMKVKQAIINERTALCAANAESNLMVLNQTGVITDTALSNAYSPPTPNGIRIALIDQCADASVSNGIYPPGGQNTLTAFTVSMPAAGETKANIFKKKWFFLMDDIEWDSTGSTTGAFSRGQSFSFAYLLRKNTRTPTPIFDLTVLVYHGRSASLYDSENDKLLQLAQMADANVPGNLAIALKALPTKEDGRTITKGSWIVDTTQWEFEFYQVQNITEGKDNTGIDCFRLELDRPLLSKFSAGPIEMFWVDHLSGVFPRGEIKFQ